MPVPVDLWRPCDLSSAAVQKRDNYIKAQGDEGYSSFQPWDCAEEGMAQSGTAPISGNLAGAGSKAPTRVRNSRRLSPRDSVSVDAMAGLPHRRTRPSRPVVDSDLDSEDDDLDSSGRRKSGNRAQGSAAPQSQASFGDAGHSSSLG